MADSFRAAFNRWEVLVSRWQPDSRCQFAWFATIVGGLVVVEHRPDHRQSIGASGVVESLSQLPACGSGRKNCNDFPHSRLSSPVSCKNLRFPLSMPSPLRVWLPLAEPFSKRYRWSTSKLQKLMLKLDIFDNMTWYDYSKPPGFSNAPIFCPIQRLVQVGTRLFHQFDPQLWRARWSRWQLWWSLTRKVPRGKEVPCVRPLLSSRHLFLFAASGKRVFGGDENEQ